MRMDDPAKLLEDDGLDEEDYLNYKKRMEAAEAEDEPMD